MSDNQNQCQLHGIHETQLNALDESFKELKGENTKLNEKIDRVKDFLNEKIEKIETNANSTFNNLSEKILTLEITTRINNENLNAKIDKIDKKVDKLVESMETRSNRQEDLRNNWSNRKIAIYSIMISSGTAILLTIIEKIWK